MVRQILLSGACTYYSTVRTEQGKREKSLSPFFSAFIKLGVFFNLLLFFSSSTFSSSSASTLLSFSLLIRIVRRRGKNESTGPGPHKPFLHSHERPQVLITGKQRKGCVRVCVWEGREIISSKSVAAQFQENNSCVDNIIIILIT